MDLNLFLISILEGITEFLPISSTAHLIIASKLIGINLSLPYVKFYLLAIQLGALMAGILIFTKDLLSNKKILKNIFISFIPSALIGFVLYKTFKSLLEGNFYLISIMLFLGGIIFIYLERYYIKNSENESGKSELTSSDAFIVGLAQAVAIIPGVSRSGATIIAGILRGVKKSTIIEYTFLLALPTLGTAVLYDSYKSIELLKAINNFSGLFIGILTSFIVALITLFLMKKYIKQISLTMFGVYRILLSIAIISIYIL